MLLCTVYARYGVAAQGPLPELSIPPEQRERLTKMQRSDRYKQQISSPTNACPPEPTILASRVISLIAQQRMIKKQYQTAHALLTQSENVVAELERQTEDANTAIARILALSGVPAHSPSTSPPSSAATSLKPTTLWAQPVSSPRSETRHTGPADAHYKQLLTARQEFQELHEAFTTLNECQQKLNQRYQPLLAQYAAQFKSIDAAIKHFEAHGSYVQITVGKKRGVVILPEGSTNLPLLPTDSATK